MSEYNMSHTGKELDDAINKVKNGYVFPTGTKEITENGTYDVSEYETAEVNIPTNASETVQEVMLVTADFSFATLNVSNLSHTYNEILSAIVNENKLVKIAVSYLLPGYSTPNTAIGDVIAVVPATNDIGFALFIETDIGSGTQLYHFTVYCRPNNIITKIRLIQSALM